MKKRTAAVLAALVLVLAAGAAPVKGELTPTGTYPILKQKLDMRFLTAQTIFIENWNTNRLSKYMEDKTNIHVKWETIPEDAVKEKLNLLLASGNYPDVIFGLGGRFGIDASTELKYGAEEKVFLPLNDLIDNYMPNFKKVLEEYPTLRGYITSSDGNIYSLPLIEETYHVTMSSKLWVYKPWLDKLNLKMPQTTDEFYNMLIAFRDKDPNGNGKKDEIPLAGAIQGWRSCPTTFLLNSFIYTNLEPNLDEPVDSSLGFYMDGKKVKTILNTPEYRDGLRYLNKLYKEGLMNEGVFTMNAETQLTQLVENPSAPIVGVVAGGWGGVYSKVGGERYRNFVALPPLKGPKGVRESRYYPPDPSIGNFVITKNCPNPTAAVRWADFFYTREGTLMLRHGFENEGWRYAQKGEVGLDGNPAIWKPLKPWNDKEPQNDCWVRVGVYLQDKAFRLGEVVPPDLDPDGPEGVEKRLYDATKKYYEPYVHPEKQIPSPLRFLSSEQEQMATLTTEFARYARQSMVKFVVGAMDLDKDWNAYIANLDKLGLQKILDMNQKAYTRQYGK